MSRNGSGDMKKYLSKRPTLAKDLCVGRDFYLVK